MGSCARAVHLHSHAEHLACVFATLPPILLGVVKRGKVMVWGRVEVVKHVLDNFEA
jgi:hypothetical protein